MLSGRRTQPLEHFDACSHARTTEACLQPSGGIQKGGRSAHLGLAPRSLPWTTPLVGVVGTETSPVAELHQKGCAARSSATPHALERRTFHQVGDDLQAQALRRTEIVANAKEHPAVLRQEREIRPVIVRLPPWPASHERFE